MPVVQKKGKGILASVFAKVVFFTQWQNDANNLRLEILDEGQIRGGGGYSSMIWVGTCR